MRSLVPIALGVLLCLKSMRKLPVCIIVILCMSPMPIACVNFPGPLVSMISSAVPVVGGNEAAGTKGVRFLFCAIISKPDTGSTARMSTACGLSFLHATIFSIL